MRLLDAELLIYEGIAELVEFADEEMAPPYAILSHTWEKEEVLFADVALGPSHEITPSAASLRILRRQNSTHRTTDVDIEPQPHVKAGWNKVLNTCLQACHDELQYAWIDTLCIDKSSSADLSEAINSMFRWYQNATVCYVYLADCKLAAGWDSTARHRALKRLRRKVNPTRRNIFSDDDRYEQATTQLDDAALTRYMREQLRSCKWFTRGWTLQELIAPTVVRFYDSRWHFIASKSDIRPSLSLITGIHEPALQSATLIPTFSIAQRMFWASNRKTTRVEDEAYCLLGIFEINMPLLYGERRNAFQRLQQEILKTSSDDSILAWEHPPNEKRYDPSCHNHVFASSPACFWYRARDIGVSERQEIRSINMVNRWVDYKFEIPRWQHEKGLESVTAVLGCLVGGKGALLDRTASRIGIRLQLSEQINGPPEIRSSQMPARVCSETRIGPPRRLIDLSSLVNTVPARILLSDDGQSRLLPRMDLFLGGYSTHRIRFPSGHAFKIKQAYPASQWNLSTDGLTLPLTGSTSYGAFHMESLEYRVSNFIVLFRVETQSLVITEHRGYCRSWIFPLLGTEIYLNLEDLCNAAPECLAKHGDAWIKRHQSIPLSSDYTLHLRAPDPILGFALTNAAESTRPFIVPRVGVFLDLELLRRQEADPLPEYGWSVFGWEAMFHGEGQGEVSSGQTSPVEQRCWYFKRDIYARVVAYKLYDAPLVDGDSVPQIPNEFLSESEGDHPTTSDSEV